MKIFDSHIHIFPDSVEKNRDQYLDDSAFSLLYTNRKSKIATTEIAANYLYINSIDGAIAYGFCWECPQRCAMHNGHLALITDKRIIPFATIPSKPFDGIYSFLKDLDLAKFMGIGELAFYSNSFTDELYNYLDIVFGFAEDNNLILALHLNEPVGHIYPGKYITPFEKIYSLIEKHRQLKIILGHWGGGVLFYELMPEVEEVFQNVYYDTAASPFLYKSDIYKAAASLCDSNKLLFGSDFPLLGLSRYLKEIEESAISLKQKENLLYNNITVLLNQQNPDSI